MLLKVYVLLEWWIIILQCFLLVSVKGQLCEPCEETMPCNISYTLQDNASILSLSWYSNGNEAITCYLGFSNCNVYPQYRKLITSLTEEKNRNLTTKLIFLKTGRQINSISIERTWKLIAYYLKLPPKVLFICDLRIYKKPKDVNCIYEVVNEGLKIRCISFLSYPKLDCVFDGPINKKVKSFVSRVNHTTVQLSPVYYNSECSIILACEYLVKCLLEFNVTFYPEKEENGDKYNYELTYPIKVDIEYGINMSTSCLYLSNNCVNETCLCGYNKQTQRDINQPTSPYKIPKNTTDTLTQEDVERPSLILKILVISAVIGILLGAILFILIRKRFKPNKPIEMKTYKYTIGKKKLLEQNDCDVEHLNQLNICFNQYRHHTAISCIMYMKTPKVFLKKNKLNTSHVQTYIDSVIHLTVCLEVTLESDAINRREDDKRMKKKGSGVIIKVNSSRNQTHKSHCLTEPSWLVYIATSTNIVSSSEDAKSTIAELFYHDKDKTDVKKIKGVGLYADSIDADSCILVCETTDECLHTKLKETLLKKKQSYNNLRCTENRVVLISHPHGFSKCISFGACHGKETENQSMFTLSRIKYDIVACRGSEGGPVLNLNTQFKQSFSNLLVADFPVHLGTRTNRLNFSGFTVMPSYNANGGVTQTISCSSNLPSEVISESLDDQMASNNGEIFESSVIIDTGACRKNNCHESFVKIKDFTIDNLPDKYKDQTVFDYISIISELTGRVEVHCTSTNRPGVDPNTQARYPGWDTKNTRNMRTGTGIVVSVLEVRDEDCSCPECEESPSKVFYKVYVLTAKHVVFDDTEARQSFFRIGYNTLKSPINKLYGMRYTEGEMNDGRSIVEFVTHKSKFGIPLSDMLTRLYKTEKKIPERFHSPDDITLAVIVSHPHGEPKHVTIGEWVDRELISTPTGLKARYFYKTDTCQGSSGAAVIVLGDMLPRVVKRLIPPHIHHTTDSDGLNVSSLGI